MCVTQTFRFDHDCENICMSTAQKGDNSEQIIPTNTTVPLCISCSIYNHYLLYEYHSISPLHTLPLDISPRLFATYISHCRVYVHFKSLAIVRHNESDFANEQCECTQWIVLSFLRKFEFLENI